MIIKAIEFPGKEFATKEDLFEYLKENENAIIADKKATVRPSDNWGFPVSTSKNDSIKALDLDEGFVYAVINTTNFMDSHNDVHLPKIWNKSIKEQKGKIYYVADHDLKIASIIAFPQDVEMLLKEMTFKELGSDLNGTTQALIFKVPIDKIRNDKALQIIEEKIDIEHSVRMQYVKIFLAIDSEAKEDKEYKKRFDKFIGEVANKQDAIDKGYFWGVTEAKISQEGSMVLFGSNEITPLLQAKEESLEDTQKDESEEIATRKEKKKKFLLRFV